MQINIVKRKDLETDKRWIMDNIEKKDLLFIRPAFGARGNIQLNSSEVKRMTIGEISKDLSDPKYVLIEVIFDDKEDLR